MELDNVQIGIVTMWIIAAAGIIILQGEKGLIGVGIILSIVMALGVFPGRQGLDKGGWSGNGAVEEGEPITEADRARAKEVPSGMDDDRREPRVLARGIVKVQLPDGRVIKARTRKIER